MRIVVESGNRESVFATRSSPLLLVEKGKEEEFHVVSE